MSVRVSSVFDLAEVIDDTAQSLIAGYKHISKGNKRDPESYQSTDKQSMRTALDLIVNIDPRQNWTVESDRTAWRRIILNLLGNAMKYTKSGLIEITLSKSQPLQKDGPSDGFALCTVNLVIQDTGCGMSEAYLADGIFQPFKQMSFMNDGVGLGLSIVKHIVQELQGNVNVQSQIGVGTLFEISMPLLVSTEASIVADSKANDESVRIGIALGQDEINKSSVPLRECLRRHVQAALCDEIRDVSLRSHSGVDFMVVGAQALLEFAQDNKSEACGVNAALPPLLVLKALQNNAEQRLQELLPATEMVFLEPGFGKRAFQKSVDDLYTMSTRKQNTDGQEPALKNARRPPQPATKALRDGASTAGETSNTTGRKHVLIVDDNDINVKILATQVKKLRFTCATAANGRQAVEAFRKSVQGEGSSTFDLVLMDVSMPVMNGYEATRAIREIEAGVLEGRSGESAERVPVVALTGLGSAEARIEGFASGMDLFFTKPVSVSRIRTLLENGLGAFASEEGIVRAG